VDSAEVGVFKESNKVRLGSLLKGKDGTALKAKVSLVVLSDLTDKSLEWEFSDKKLS
jgi:hypothetical protein